MKPIIGIISARHDFGTILPFVSTTAHYIEEIAAAGGIPIQIPLQPYQESSELDAILNRCDGILLPGGGDFDPQWYGERLLPNLQPDEFAPSRGVQTSAIHFVRKAAASGKPVLGICLGMQVMNVALGGSLYQDIPTQILGHLTHAAKAQDLSQRWQGAHTVATAQNSLIRQLSGEKEITVNSFHHQAVKDLAPGFKVTAAAPDGVAECIEHYSGNLLGVQWHPENLSHAGVPHAQALFRWLVDKASYGR